MSHGRRNDDIRKQLLELKEGNQENKICADCGRSDTMDWVSVFRGVFVCIECAGIHRHPKNETPIVRSINLDILTEAHLEMMKSKGNKACRLKLEVDIPPCWLKPWPKNCPYALREQWIEAKYTRKEFTKDATHNALRHYLTGEKQGFLKKKKLQTDSNVYQDRWFVVKDGKLSYFRDRRGPPTETISIFYINVALHVPEVVKSNSMLITYFSPAQGKTRNVFVTADNSFEIIDWFLTIRQAKIKILKAKFKDMTDEEARKHASQEYTHYGWMNKTSPNGRKMRERFFVLVGRCLRYYNSPKAAYPLGELVLSSPSDGYWVDENIPQEIQNSPSTLMLHVPDRARGGYPLQAPDIISKKQWMSVLTNTIENALNMSGYLPSSYDNDTDALKRESTDSDCAELSVSITAQRMSWASSHSESSGSGTL